MESIETYLSDAKVVGIGTGRTVNKLIQYLPKHLLYVPSSMQTLICLSKAGYNTTNLSTCSSLDVYIDGADYFDDKGNLIKGKGGAFVAEKIMCGLAEKVLIVVQEHKYREVFNECHVPIAVVRNAFSYVISVLEKHHISYTVRSNGLGGPSFSEDGFIIIDMVYREEFIKDVCSVPGVVEHGFFGCDEFNVDMKVTKKNADINFGS